MHCAAGRDRTGLVTLLLLALVGVAPDEVVADYALSAERLRVRWAAEGRDDEDVAAQALLGKANASARSAILATLDRLDAAAYLRAGGLRADQEAAIRARLFAASEGCSSTVP